MIHITHFTIRGYFLHMSVLTFFFLLYIRSFNNNPPLQKFFFRLKMGGLLFHPFWNFGEPSTLHCHYTQLLIEITYFVTEMYLFHQQIKIYTPYIRHTVKINVGRTHRTTFALTRYYGGLGSELPSKKLDIWSSKNVGIYSESNMNPCEM